MSREKYPIVFEVVHAQTRVAGVDYACRTRRVYNHSRIQLRRGNKIEKHIFRPLCSGSTPSGRVPGDRMMALHASNKK